MKGTQMGRSVFLGWVAVTAAACLMSCAVYDALKNPPSQSGTVAEQQATHPDLEQQQAAMAKLESENRWLMKEATALRSENEVLAATNQKLTESLKNLTKQLQVIKSELDRQRSVVRIQNEVIALLDDTRNTIASSLQEQVAAEKIEFRESRDQLRLVLLDTIVFEPGSMGLTAEGKKVLAALAESLRGQSQPIVVEGHTDNLPIGTSLRERFPSNWELSAARAAAVARFLQSEGGINPGRLSIQAFSYHRPVADNRTEEGRRRNRRIEIVLGEARP
jgi:chemotaxis protein MotB